MLPLARKAVAHAQYNVVFIRDLANHCDSPAVILTAQKRHQEESQDEKHVVGDHRHRTGSGITLRNKRGKIRSVSVNVKIYLEYL